MSKIWPNANHIHFIGIGGIGLSAIARLCLLQGKTVTGSDMSLDSPVVSELVKVPPTAGQAGAKIYEGHKADQLPTKATLVIYSLAITDDNPELVEARARGISTLSYPQALGLMAKDKYTIAIAGTHGKTTTTAMVAGILLEAKLDPTVIVGSLLKTKSGQGSNLIVGQSKYLVAEACEYRRSFLNLSPRILVITNIDNDHLDYYRDLADIQSAFAPLAAKVPKGGFLICAVTDPLLAPVIKNSVCQIVDYEKIESANLKLLVPGAHNVKNAQAALAVGEVLKISPPISVGALNKFNGTWRRFEFLGQTKSGAFIYDDYGHHPNEIKATLTTMRNSFPKARLVVAFQPHLYSRTKLLFNEFVTSFNLVDELLLLPIYAAREVNDSAITSQTLAAAIPHSKYFPNFLTAQNYLVQTLRAGDVFLTLGAGNVYKIAETLVSPLTVKAPP